MSRRDKRKEEIRQAARRLAEVLDVLEAAFGEAIRGRPGAAGSGGEPQEGEETPWTEGKGSPSPGT